MASFRSTRTGQFYSFKEAVMNGWASDKGMILPSTIPHVSSEVLESWIDYTYPDLVVEILSLFLHEEDFFPEFASIINESFVDFLSPNVVEIQELDIGLQERSESSSSSVEDVRTEKEKDKEKYKKKEEEKEQVRIQEGGSIYVAELFLGPSLAFKDLGMQVLCRVLEHFLKEENQRRVILVGTSGDTGPSALEASKSNTYMKMLVLYPISRVSSFQQAQMLRADAEYPQATVIAVEGTSDDLDVPCANVFSEPKFVERHTLGTVNSVNVIRLLVQVVHFFYIHLQLIKRKLQEEEDKGQKGNSKSSRSYNFSYVIPTGAAGHVTACIIARLMGLPMTSILIATNENDVLHRMLHTGILKKKETVVATNAPAMDIQAPYNIERILRLLLTFDDPDNFNIHEFMETFNQGKEAILPSNVLMKMQQELQIRSTVVNGTSKNCETGTQSVLSTIKQVYDATKMRSIPKSISTLVSTSTSTSPTATTEIISSGSSSSNGYILDPHTAIGVAGALHIESEKKKQNSLDNHNNKNHSGTVCMGCAHPLKFTSTIAKALEMSIEETTEKILTTSSTPKKLETIWQSYQNYLLENPDDVQSCQRFIEKEETQWTAHLINVIDRLENE